MVVVRCVDDNLMAIYNTPFDSDLKSDDFASIEDSDYEMLHRNSFRENFFNERLSKENLQKNVVENRDLFPKKCHDIEIAKDDEKVGVKKYS